MTNTCCATTSFETSALAKVSGLRFEVRVRVSGSGFGFATV